MKIPQVLLTLCLLAFACDDTSAVKNDRGESSLSVPNFIRRSRRITLNEYLVPPPLPRHHSVRSGRVANPSPTDAPGYFSKLMNWLNPFNSGPSPSTPVKSPPSVETFYSTPQLHGPSPFHLHATPQSGPSYPISGPQAQPLYPPLSQPPPSVLTLPSPPRNPSPVYNVPPTISYNIHHGLPPLKINPAAVNKGKSCNPCNKLPWIPMQDGELRSDKYLPPSQHSNGYLPPSNTGNHDAQHAASHEINVSSYSKVPTGQNTQNPLSNPFASSQLYTDPVAPVYNRELFHPPRSENWEHFESATSSSLEQKHESRIAENFNIRERQVSIGAQSNQGHTSREIEINKELKKKELYGDQPPISRPTDQSNQGNQHAQDNSFEVTNFDSSNFKNHEFTSDNRHHESFKSYPESNVQLNYSPYPNTQDLNPSASFGATIINDQSAEFRNTYSDDLSPSSSIAKDSHVTTQIPQTSSASLNNNFIHFEQSSLLDFSKTDGKSAGTHWPTSTVTSNVAQPSESTLKTTTEYSLETENAYFQDSSNLIGQNELYSLSKIQNINLGTTTPFTIEYSNVQDIDVSTTGMPYVIQQSVSYTQSSSQARLPLSDLGLNTLTSRNETVTNHAFLDLAYANDSSIEVQNFEQQDSLKDAEYTHSKQPGVKRNKQVQVIIPYTSEYTPIPFQQSYGDWSIKTAFEKVQPRRLPSPNERNIDNYVQEESRNDIRVTNHLQPPSVPNNSNKLNVQPITTSAITVQNSTKNIVLKLNNSIDVRRLQKNIDNWTIQEYSKPTTSSTILPSSPHPYLSPSKKIPTKYLTTTEPGDRTSESNDHNESVKTYSLAGFSFNEVEHEGSASNHIEETRTPLNVSPVETTNTTNIGEEGANNKSATEEKLTWEEYLSATPVNKEQVFVVTPQSSLRTSTKDKLDKQKEEERENTQLTTEPVNNGGKNSNGNFSEFEAIEKAYQVLPQAVNNLAVASTGKENIPLWGIMEHEEFASLNLDDTDEGATAEGIDGPVLYSGHSKVSRAKR